MKCFFRRPLKSFRDEVKMKEELKIRFLSDLIDFKNGKSIKPSSGNIPIYGGNGILGYSEKYNYKNILIIGRVGAYCGSIHYHKEKCWVSDNAIAGEVKSDYSIDYLYYLMKSLNLNDRQVGSSQPLLTQGVLNNISVKIYESSQTQQSIAAVLSALDKKIALNKQINARLEQMAKTLYDYWFVQFDFPDANGKPYKSSGGEMVFDETLKREIPKGWKSFKLSELVTLSTGKEDANFATEQGIYPFFTCSEKILKCDVYSFDTQAILLAGNGTFSVKRFTGRFNAYQRTYVLEPKSKNLYPIVYFVIIDNVVKFTSGSRGSIIKFITRGDIENIDVVLPNDIENMRFSEVLYTYLLQAELLEKQNYQLTQLRDFLLPMLMNGQVSVAE